MAKFLSKSKSPKGMAKYGTSLDCNFGMEGPLLRMPLYVGGRLRLTDASWEGDHSDTDVNELVSHGELLLARRSC